MKRLAIPFLSLLLGIAAQSFAQSANTQPTAAPLPPVGAVDCATVHATASCASFNDMMKAGQFNDFLGNLRIKTWVCFRQDQDSFLILHYFLPRYWATDRTETSRIQKDVQENARRKINDKYLRGVETSAPLSFVEYADRTQSGKFDTVLKWKKLSEQDDIQATGISKGPDISISQAGVVLSTAYTNSTGSWFYWLTIDSDRTFSEAFKPVGQAQETGDSSKLPANGYCAEF
jgi:hypothetical protein